MTGGQATLALRLAGPLQSWGTRSAFNRRETDLRPSKSGVLGLLAAAQGRPRDADITDLIHLRLGVRVDSPGSVLRDFHTVSDYRGGPLLSASVKKSGEQKPTSPAKHTGVTQRMYLQDAVFLAAVRGPRDLVETLGRAVRHPTFPLALGRRSCVPAQPMLIRHGEQDVWDADLDDVLKAVPWQVSQTMRRRLADRSRDPYGVRRLPITIEVIDGAPGDDVATDVPVSFNPRLRGFATRTVRHGWVDVATALEDDRSPRAEHDPFELLGEE